MCVLYMCLLSSTEVDCQSSSPSDVHSSIKSPPSTSSPDTCNLPVASSSEQEATTAAEQSMECLQAATNISQTSEKSDVHLSTTS